MRILLTNDDSVDSPLLALAVDCLKPLGELTVVVPKEEQSWKAKSMTRFGDLKAEPFSLQGVQAMTLTGTPADCANFGIYNLYDEKPDLVVAGINIGVNAGLSFTISSGTVGACLEANIADVPAVALSQRLPSGVFDIWGRTRQFPHDEITGVKRNAHAVTERLFEKLIARPDFLEERVTWNVNIPERLAEGWKLEPCFAGRSFYAACFKKVGDAYQHRIDPPSVDMREGSDIKALADGHVSVTKVDVRAIGQERFSW